MAAEGFTVGVVTGVQAISWQKITIHGQAAHSGTTPMELRVDAGLAGARIVCKIRELVDSITELRIADPRLRIDTHRMAKTRHVPFDEGVQKTIAAAMDDLGLQHMSLMSGAGHDAQEVAAIAPAAMIFVRGEYDGISHNPRGYSTPEACARGVDVLATTLLRLANE